MLACNPGADTNVRAAAVREEPLCRLKEAWMPEAKHNTRCKQGFPVLMRGDDGVHEPEETFGLVEHLHVDVENNMPVLFL